MAIPREHWISPEEYLEIDRASLDTKYEYVRGHMYPVRGNLVNLAGGKIAHVQIAANVYLLLREHLQGKPCRAYPSDMRVQIAENLYFFPDVAVTCNPEDWQHRDQEDVIFRPCLIVEVLSPSTEAYDRGDKFTEYQTCLSIQEYVLINAQYQKVEVYRRQEDGEKWTYQQFGHGQEVKLETLGFKVPIAALYDLTEVPEVQKLPAKKNKK